MADLGTRVLVAVIGIPFVVAVSWTGGLYFLLFIALASSLALWEFYQLSKAKGAKPVVALGIMTGLCVNLTFYYSNLQMFLFTKSGFLGFPSQSQLFFIVFLLGTAAVCLAELFRNDTAPLLNISTTLFGIVYISLFLGTLVGVREFFNFPRWHLSGESTLDPRLDALGGYTVIALFACIWICDSAAYFVGQWGGRHKLFPRVSPNKTWEGTIAGFLAAIGTGIAAKYLLIDYLSLAQAVVFGAIVGLFGQLGDLVESLIKRDAGVKDSSSMIPGHGGVFDRFDSLIFVSPMMYLYLGLMLPDLKIFGGS